MKKIKWDEIIIVNDNGDKVRAKLPVIISASRATDIPAFYSDWFIHRLRKGYVKWKNAFNGKSYYYSFDKTRVIVFWSKNPKPLFKYINEIEKLGINFYFQFTLNDYEKEKYEPGVPPLKNRIETFKELSKKIGKEKVIWRFDPLLLTEKINISDLLKKINLIGNELADYTNKLVISFADIKIYKKVQNNLRKNNIKYYEWDDSKMKELAKGLQKLNKQWNLKIATCAEKISLEEYDIQHNKCIDDNLMIELFKNDKELMIFLGYKDPKSNLFEFNNNILRSNLKDKGQRKYCGCIISKDIGSYNTCPHMCVYCYANTSKKIVMLNYKNHKVNSISESII